jgi:hypothetical protein
MAGRGRKRTCLKWLNSVESKRFEIVKKRNLAKRVMVELAANDVALRSFVTNFVLDEYCLCVYSYIHDKQIKTRNH